MIDVSFNDIIKLFPKESDGSFQSIPVNHHKLTDTTDEYKALKNHVRMQMSRPSGSLSCISFHGVPYTVINDDTTEVAFDIINMKSHKTIEGRKGKLVFFTDMNDLVSLNFRIGLVEGLHRSHIFHEVANSISEERKNEKMFKLTLYFGGPDAQFLQEDCTLFAKRSYSLSLELRSGNEHTLFDAMHNCVSHVISKNEYTIWDKDKKGINKNSFVFVHSEADIKKITAGQTDKKKVRALLKRDVDNQYKELLKEKFAVETEFMRGFISNLKLNRLVAEFIASTTKLNNGGDLFNLDCLLSNSVPNVGYGTFMPLVTQGTKKKGTVISMRCITDGGCPLQLFFITSILLSTVMHSRFAEVSPFNIFGTGLYHFSPDF